MPLEADLSVAYSSVHISYNRCFNMQGYEYFSSRAEYSVCALLHLMLDRKYGSPPSLEMNLKRPNVPVRVSCIED